MKELHIKLYGKVQGVNFRSSTKVYCDNKNIYGIVWNNNDQTVEIIAQGEEKDLKELLKWTYHGVTAAVVDKVEYTYRNINTDYEDFRVLRNR